MKIWEEKADEQQIVGIATSHSFTLFVTEKGQLWARGESFLEMLDQASKETVQVKLPAGQLCRRAWVGKASASPCAFVELEDESTGKKCIYSAGRSEYGLLGQGSVEGTEVKESREFKKLALESEDVQFDSLSVSNSAVMAIDSKGQLWGWGHNESQRLGLPEVAEKGVAKPTELAQLNNLKFKAKKAECSNVHSLVLFEDLKGKDVLYSVGTSGYKHLGVPEDQLGDAEKRKATPFREIPTFSDRKVADFVAGDRCSLVILQCDGAPAEQLYNHVLPEGKKAQGLLHFYKKGDAWHFIP